MVNPRHPHHHYHPRPIQATVEYFGERSGVDRCNSVAQVDPKTKYPRESQYQPPLNRNGSGLIEQLYIMVGSSMGLGVVERDKGRGGMGRG